MIVSSNNSQVDSKYKHNRLHDVSATILAGGTTWATKKLLDRYFERPILAPGIINEFNHPLTLNEVEQLNHATQYALDSTGLRQKGVQVINHNTLGVSYHEPGRITRFLNDMPMPNFIRNRLHLNREQLALDSVARGINACFDSKMNAILINEDRQHVGIMHELGHAYNKNNSFIWKAIQKYGCKASRYIPGAIILFTLLTKQSKPEEDKELTKPQKAKNFIRKHSPALVFATMLPKLAEEYRASALGKQFSLYTIDSARLIERIKHMNKIGITSYATGVLILMTCACIARDSKNIFSKILNNKKHEKTDTKEDTIKNTNNINSFIDKTKSAQS